MLNRRKITDVAAHIREKVPQSSTGLNINAARIIVPTSGLNG
jgi:hypothetical protein